MRVLFKRLIPVAKTPERKRNTDAGLDFYSVHNEVIQPGGHATVHLGVAWEVLDIPEGMNCYCQLQSRSGLAFKNHIEVTNAGVIDQEYRGEFAVKLYNIGKEAFHISPGMRVCQGVVKLLPQFTVEETLILSESSRNADGFGSSGA